MSANEPKPARGASRCYTHIDDAGFFKLPEVKSSSLIPYKAVREDLRPPIAEDWEIATSKLGSGYETPIFKFSYGFSLTEAELDYVESVKKKAEEHQKWVESHSFPNRIVIAANLYECGTVILGVRHNGIEMLKQLAFLTSIGKKPKDRCVQGFMDIFGQFRNREEAWIIANEAGQILPGKDKTPGKLFSETIY